MAETNNIASKVFRHIGKGEFTNRHGVKFEAQDLWSLNAEARIFAPTERVDLFLEFFAEKKEFARELNIKTIRDLYSIDRSFLKQLYNEGKGQIVCRINLGYSYFLTYKLTEGKIIAENERLVKHPVPVKLCDPEDFIEYAKNYYALVDSCEN